jgi:hypothetical protein
LMLSGIRSAARGIKLVRLRQSGPPWSWRRLQWLPCPTICSGDDDISKRLYFVLEQARIILGFGVRSLRIYAIRCAQRTGVIIAQLSLT